VNVFFVGCVKIVGWRWANPDQLFGCLVNVVSAFDLLLGIWVTDELANDPRFALACGPNCGNHAQATTSVLKDAIAGFCVVITEF
jgi:hypothetical protein